MKISILVVDNEPVICDAFAHYLEQVGPQFSECAIDAKSVYTLEDALSIIASDNRPNLVFLDLNLDRHHRSIVTLQQFQHRNPFKVPVVVFSGLSTEDEATPDILRQCINDYGAQAILMKSTNPTITRVGLPRILAGERWIPDEILTLLLRPPRSTPSLDLTPRQWDVARGLTRGLRNKEIARELGLADGNVRQIITHIYKRLNVKSRVGAARVVENADTKKKHV
jgi:DNA-binding NarL/FixJ family response regulator